MSKTQAAVMTETPTKAKRIPVAWPALVTAVVLIAAGVAYPWARGAVANYRADKALVSAIAAIGRFLSCAAQAGMKKGRRKSPPAPKFRLGAKRSGAAAAEQRQGCHESQLVAECGL